MNNDQEQEFLKFLKDGSELRRDREIDAVMNTLDLMATNLHSLAGPQGAVFTSLADRLKSSVHSLRSMRYGVMEYFSGKGPVARKLREHAAIARYLERGDYQQLQAELEQRLRHFDYAPTNHVDRYKELETFLVQHVIPLVYNEKRPVAQQEWRDEITVRTPSGFYLLNHPGQQERNALVLNAELPTRFGEQTELVKVVLVAVTDVRLQMFYWHPQEAEWISSDLKTFVPFTLQALEAEFKKVAATMAHLNNEPRDWVQEFAALQEKAQRVFEQEELLPTNYLSYVRDGDASEITLQHNDYGIVFRSTRGAYAMQSTSVVRYHGLFPHAMSFLDLPDDVKQKLVRVGNYDLDNLQEHIDTTVNRRATQPACQTLSQHN